MTTIPQQIQALNNNITSLRAMVNGFRDPGKFYAMLGDLCIYGCKITQGTSASDMYLALDGEASGDESRLNPDVETTPLRHEEYPNIALIYGEVFEMSNVNKSDESDESLLLDDAPGTAGYGRYDIIYAYVGKAGPAVSILTGAASAAVKTAFDGTGLDSGVYPSTYDPALPKGTLPLARVYVEVGDTGIANARIYDLRPFNGRVNPMAESTGRFFAHTGAGLGSGNLAARVFTTVVEDTCQGITYSGNSTDGAKFTCTEAGEYVFAYFESGQQASGFCGLSLNSPSLSTSVESLAVAERETRIAKISHNLQPYGARVESTIRLNPGDFIVPHCTIGTWASENSTTVITVRKMFNL